MTANKRVPNSADSSLTVVQASTGDIVATISANASLLSGPTGASFDGEQVPVANSSGNSVTLFKAADLSVLGDVTTRSSTSPFGPCSDGIASGWASAPSESRPDDPVEVQFGRPTSPLAFRATYSSKRPVTSRSRSYRLVSGNGGNQDSRRTIQLS